MYACMHACMCVCVTVCMDVCMYVCVYVYVYVYIYNAYIHPYIPYIYIHIYIYRAGKNMFSCQLKLPNPSVVAPLPQPASKWGYTAPTTGVGCTNNIYIYNNMICQVCLKNDGFHFQGQFQWEA